jgi:oligoribonuclease NrnB/cAMP/cGMP phosphodiesterase (DHH superfamily)
MIVIHHNDADGRTSAAIVGRSRYAREGTVEYIEADYTKAQDKEWCDKLKQKCLNHAGSIFIVDFSLPEKWMMEVHLNARGPLYWIDHHASCKDYSQKFEGLRNFKDKDQAACEIAWEFCHPDEDAPLVVRLVGDYDCWRLKEEESSKPLIAAMDAYQYMPGDKAWNDLLGGHSCYHMGKDTADDVQHRRSVAFQQTRKLIDEGRVMIKYRDGYCKGLLDQIGFETEFEGHKMLALNVARQGSSAFGKRFKDYDACLSFYYDGKTWTVSMYSETIDCRPIAKKYGGGGHRGAVGWQIAALPFSPIKKG